MPGQADKSARCLNFVQNYVIPAAQFADRKFGQDPAILRYVLLHLVALDTIILAYSLGVTSAATAGRLVLGGIAATAVGVACDKYDWGSFLPTLGVMLLVNGSLGLPGLMGLVTFLPVNYANDWVGPSNKGSIRR
ncbi:hypothetical protein CPB97_012155 [Podila verticillata]|nr:hypothetical protein CPB97_012155 [Podila verticillata]